MPLKRLDHSLGRADPHIIGQPVPAFSGDWSMMLPASPPSSNHTACERTSSSFQFQIRIATSHQQPHSLTNFWQPSRHLNIDITRQRTNQPANRPILTEDGERTQVIFTIHDRYHRREAGSSADNHHYYFSTTTELRSQSPPHLPTQTRDNNTATESPTRANRNIHERKIHKDRQKNK